MTDTPTQMAETQTVENMVIKIDGVQFACACRCNVFHRPEPDHLGIYECNGCGAWYKGDRKADGEQHG